MDRELQLLLLGGLIGFVGAILGGLAEAGFSYLFENLRYRREGRRRWLKTALEWATTGRKESLRRADLERQDLRGADLTGADLGNAKLHKANLSGADLSSANLRRADLRKAKLIWTRVGHFAEDAPDPYVTCGANLSEADLRGADLHGAQLYGIQLDGATLCGAELSSVNLRGADLSRANLRGVKLRGAELLNVKLRGANLRGADLREAILCVHAGENVLTKEPPRSILMADLSEADLSRANLKGADVTAEQLAQARSLKGAIMPDGTKHD